MTATPSTPTEPSDGLLRHLSEAECWQHLAELHVGRLAYIVRGAPMILPLNYAARDGSIWLRTASYNKMAVRLPGQVVAFEIDEVDIHGHTGWSVLVRGPVEHVLGAAATSAWSATAPWPDGLRTMMFRIKPTQVSGRVLSAGDVAPPPGQGPGTVQRAPLVGGHA